MRATQLIALASCAATAVAQAQDLTKLISNNPNLTKFNDLVKSYADITSPFASLNHISILAPSNDAFDKIANSNLGPAFAANDTDTIRSVIEYHILNGTLQSDTITSAPSFLPSYLTNVTYSNVTGGSAVQAVRQAGNVIVLVSGFGSRSTLMTKDLAFTGGTVQVIDTFLTPPQNFMNTTKQFNLTSAGGAVAKANLNITLNEARDVTIFVPNNEAFQRVGSGLKDLSVQELTNILGYHYVNGTVRYSTSLTNNTVLTSSTGKKLTVYSGGNSLYVNNAKVLQQDILLSNGVLHVIDNILDYNATAVVPNLAIPTQPPIFPGSAVSDVPFTSDFPTTITSAPSSAATADASGASTATDGSDSSPTTSDSGPTSTSKGAGATLLPDSRRIAALLGGAVMVAAAL